MTLFAAACQPFFRRVCSTPYFGVMVRESLWTGRPSPHPIPLGGESYRGRGCRKGPCSLCINPLFRKSGRESSVRSGDQEGKPFLCAHTAPGRESGWGEGMKVRPRVPIRGGCPECREGLAGRYLANAQAGGTKRKGAAGEDCARWSEVQLRWHRRRITPQPNTQAPRVDKAKTLGSGIVTNLMSSRNTGFGIPCSSGQNGAVILN